MADDLRIFQARVIVDGQDARCDAIEHEGRFWLVPNWLEYTQEGLSIPARAIGLRSIPHIQMKPDANVDYDLLIGVSLPKFLFDDAPLPPKARGYEILEKPDIRRTLPTRH